MVGKPVKPCDEEFRQQQSSNASITSPTEESLRELE